MSLSTQADLEKYLQIEFDNDPEPVVTYLIEGADALIVSFLGFNPESEDGLVELHDPTFTEDLWVSRPPIRALTSISVDGTAIAASSFVAYLEGERSSGLIRKLNGRWSSLPRGIQVTYDGGYSEVPFDIRDASTRIVARAFQKGTEFAADGHAPGVRSISLAGSDSITWSEGADDVSKGSLALDAVERATLSRYKRSWIA